MFLFPPKNTISNEKLIMFNKINVFISTQNLFLLSFFEFCTFKYFFVCCIFSIHTSDLATNLVSTMTCISVVGLLVVWFIINTIIYHSNLITGL